MPSTPTTRNKLELQAPGENGNTWGEHNNDVITKIDFALDGMTSFSLSTTKALTHTNYALDEASARFINITGGTGGTVTIPNVQKNYLVYNGSSGNAIFTTGSGTSATIGAGLLKWIVCDGSNVVRASDSGEMASRAKATVAELRAGTADKGITVDTIGSALTLATLTDATTIAVDWATFNRAKVVLGGNRTLGNPTNVVANTQRLIYVQGDGGTIRSLAFASNYKGELPTINDATSTRWYLLSLDAYSATHITVASIRAL